MDFLRGCAAGISDPTEFHLNCGFWLEEVHEPVLAQQLP